MGRLHQSRGGFTLIELSIVLVIIGLIVGGVLVGQDLIRAAGLKSVITDVNRYVTAIHTFQTKYNNELPGDMPDATNYWGTSLWCPTGNSTPGSTLTCNGNGDSQIGSGAFAQDGPGAGDAEAMLVWQHLANAGLVGGGYTGFPASPIYQPGVNIPQSGAFPNAGFTIFYYGPISTGPLFFVGGGISHVILFGGKSPYLVDNWAGTAAYPVLSTQDAYNIDTKIDDGMPGTGKVFSLPKGSDFTPTGTPTAACATGGPSAAATATYDFTQTGPQCALLFVTGF
jgi:prepilin-type N-terminal cleavage/methylation domain-containing protein